MQKLFLGIVLLGVLHGCGVGGDDIHYFLTFNEEIRQFEDQVSESQLKGVSYFRVRYKQGRPVDFAFYQKGLLSHSHKLIYDHAQRLKEQKNFHKDGNLVSIQYFSPAGYIKKITKYDLGKKIVREEFYNEAQERIRDTKFEYNKKLIVKAIDYQYADVALFKRINYFKYLLHNNKMKKVIDKIEEYENNKLVGHHIFIYDSRGIKSQVKHFQFGKLHDVSIYSQKGTLKVKQQYNAKGKIDYKTFYDEKGKKILKEN